MLSLRSASFRPERECDLSVFYTSSYQKRMEMKHRPRKTVSSALNKVNLKKKKKREKQRPSEMEKVLHVRSNIC